jgi:outer membrane protein, heavy metal efflux system
MMKKLTSYIKNIKTSKIVLGAVLELTLMSASGFAQSLDSLIAEALRNNPLLKSHQYKIIANERRAESVNNLPAPNVSLEFSQIPTGNFDILNQSLSNNLAVSQMFMLGGKLDAMANVEKQNTHIEKDNLETAKVNLTAQIKMAYFSLWQLGKKIEVLKKNISLLNNLISAVETYYQQNKTNPADILSLRSEAAVDETELLNLQRQTEPLRYRLNKLTGRRLDDANISISSDLPKDTLSLTQTQLEEALRGSNPDLQKMSSMTNMNKAMIEANNKELIPDLMIQGMLMRMPKGMILTSKSDLMMLDGKTEIMYSIMASINLPFAPWSVNKYKAKEQELYAGINGIEYEKQDMEREMISKLNELVAKYKASDELKKLYEGKTLPLAEETIRAQEAAYQNNKTGVNAVIDSYRMRFMQEMNLYMAQADSQMALAEIEMMIGAKLPNGL